MQSSRRPERETLRNVEVMWLLGRLSPGHKTITDFRKDNGKAICKVCAQFVELCRQIGLLAVASMAIDGSKFKAVNNRDRNFTKAKMERRKKQIEESISRHLHQLDSADRQEPSEAITSRVTRLNEKIAKLKEEMKRLEALETQMLATSDEQISLTDPDARSMATSGRGSGVVGYPRGRPAGPAQGRSCALHWLSSRLMEVKAGSCVLGFNALTCRPLQCIHCGVGADVMERILVALDGSTHSNRALDLATDLAEKYQSELLLVHVVPTAPLDESEQHMAAVEYADELSSQAKEWSEARSGEQSPSGPELLLRYGDLASRFRELVAKRLMSSAESKLQGRRLRSTESILQAGDPAKTILDLAESRSVNAIVIGSRGLGEISGLLLGSVSHKVNQLANCVCITVK